MDTEVVIEVLKKVNEYKILAAQLIDTAEPYIERLADMSVDIRARMIKRLMEEHGFSHSDALLLTLDIQTSTLKSIKDSGKR